METIPFLVNVLGDESEQNVKGWFSRDEDVGIVDVPVEVLKRNLSSVCGGVAQALADLAAVGKFRLKTVTLQVEVGAEGGVSLLGTAKATGKGAIVLTFEE